MSRYGAHRSRGIIGTGSGEAAAPDHEIGWAAFAILGASAVVGIYACVELRSLFADGSYYFLRILEQDVVKSWPTRVTVDLVRQPLFIAFARFGPADIYTLGVAFGLCIQLAPTLMILASWLFLPPGRKFLFVLPLVAAVGGLEASSFSAITEGAAAAGYFWLLLFALLFARFRWLPMALPIALAAGCLHLHEAISFLGPVLALVAVARAWKAPTHFEKYFFAALALWFLFVAALQVYFIFNPYDLSNRDSFIVGLTRFRWLRNVGRDWNLPAFYGALAVPLTLALGVWAWVRTGTWRDWVGWAVVVAFVACAAVDIGLALADGRLFAAGSQFAARNNALMLSGPLALAAIILSWRPGWAHRVAVRQCLVLAGLLEASILAWHIGTIGLWSDYVTSFREILARHRGYVAFSDAIASLPPERARIVWMFSHGWLEPTLSIILAPHGEVKTIIDKPKPGGWQPFDPRNPAQLPRSKYWRYDEYLRALAEQKRGKTLP
ncbi:MAG: hypothetical protein KIT16_19420 [Rhodospirillaceae bacterium]|nr:hypothetical protein [Rhodospirillaceae bacterium]